MTRINANIKPSNLVNKHLLAEHREIKRIPNHILKCIKEGKKVNMNGQPAKFKLGTGHVKFFYDKQKFLFNRYKSIYEECLKRGFNVQDYSESWLALEGTQYWNDWVDIDDANELVYHRINERLDITYEHNGNWNSILNG